MTCRHCGRCAGCHSGRERALQSLLGPTRYRRAYYHCRRRGRGAHPSDDQAGATSRGLAPAVEQLATLAGAVGGGFERGADLLRGMAGVRLSGPAVERATEDVGQRIAGQLGAGTLFGEAAEWGWHADFRGRGVACSTIDATGTRQRGPGGARAGGRMACVAGAYNPPPHRRLRPPGKGPPRPRARYVSGLCSLRGVGPLVRRLAAQVGMGRAELWAVRTGGGGGLEEFARMNFNRAGLVTILGPHHAAGHPEGLARALHPGDEGEAAARGRSWCSLLEEEGGAAALAALREWPRPARQPAALREQRARAGGRFASNPHRMGHPEHQAEGRRIGSGAGESACKTAVGRRLQGAGMRGGEAGAHAVCHVRALYRSEKGQWEAFRQRRFTCRTPVHQLN